MGEVGEARRGAAEGTAGYSRFDAPPLSLQLAPPTSAGGGAFGAEACTPIQQAKCMIFTVTYRELEKTW